MNATAPVSPAPLPIALADVEAAALAIAGKVIRTPCLKSETLSAMTGAQVWLKFENLQFTAAYKERGALNRLLTLTAEERARGVIAAPAEKLDRMLSFDAAMLASARAGAAAGRGGRWSSSSRPLKTRCKAA